MKVAKASLHRVRRGCLTSKPSSTTASSTAVIPDSRRATTVDSVINTPAGLEDPAAHAVAWVRTWGASPQAPDDSVSRIEPFENATLRQIVRVSGGGHRVRLRISNEYGTAPLTIGAARVALTDTDDGIRHGSDHEVTFSGRPAVTVPTGAPILSDPVDLRTAALSRLTISLCLPDRVDTATCHGTFHTLGWIVPGDATALVSLPADAATLPAQALITAVEVQPGTPTRAIAVLGDSRVDGVGSTPGTDRRWTDGLAERLAARGGQAFCVVGQGISGNRMLTDGIGTAALARFDRDILATPGLGHVVIAVGNDLVLSFAPPAPRRPPDSSRCSPAHPSTWTTSSRPTSNWRHGPAHTA